MVHLYPGWNGRFEQISAGPFRAQIEIAQGQLLRVFRGVGNQSILTRGLGAEQWVDFSPVTARNEQIRWQGRKRDSGRLVVRGPAVAIDNLTVRNNEVLTVSIRPEDLQKAATVLLQSDADVSRIHWSCLSTNPVFVSNLERSARDLLVAAAHCKATADFHAEFRQREEECLTATLQGFVPTTAGDREPLHRRSKILGKAEEFLRGRLMENVGLLDLCTELGVSARTLQYAFQEQFGVGPIEYFRMLRLNAVRDQLKQAAGVGPRVRQIAGRFGFSHFSNFAADYRRQFGELPSKTLQAVR